MTIPRIRHVRAFVIRGGGADYHDQADGHWIDDHIATPMAKYPEYRPGQSRYGDVPFSLREKVPQRGG